MDKFNSLLADVKSLQKQLADKQTQFEDIDKKFNTIKTQIQNYQNNIKKQRNRIIIRRLQIEINKLMAQFKPLENTQNTLKTEISKITQQISDKQNELGTLVVSLSPEYSLAKADSTDISKVEPISAPTSGLKRGLLVGINYVGTPYELAGCINDVNNMKEHLASLYPSCKDYRVITDSTSMKPNRKTILDSIQWLVSDLKEGENVYFHYSGHGGRIVDRNGDEASGMDSCIYPVDGSRVEVITDDELREYIVNKIPKGCKCFVVIDACHSGTAVDLRYLWECDKAGVMSYREDKKYVKSEGTVVFLSAAHDVQTAADTVDTTNRPAGALTWALIETWKTYGADIKTKYLLWDVRQFLKERGYDQIPQLSTGSYLDLQEKFNIGV